MEIKKEGDYLVAKIPLKDTRDNPYENHPGPDYTCLCGVIDHNNNTLGGEFSINRLIDMTYKGKDDQVGCPIIMLDSRKQLEEVCSELGLFIYEI